MTRPLLPILLEPEDLPEQLDSDDFRLVDLSKSEQYMAGHIPGAVHLPPGSIVAPAPTPGFMPEQESLRELFGSLGHHPALHYISTTMRAVAGPVASSGFWIPSAINITAT